MPATWRSRIPEISQAVPIQVGAALAHGTEEMAQMIGENAPRSEGGEHQTHVPLSDSFKSGPGESKHVGGPSFGIWGNWYWFFSEYGTIHESAQPYLMPVVESQTPALVAEVREALVRL